ncbi:MAG: hypothetical protein RJQ00_11060 [Vicingaceae bacterium]
MTLSKILTLLGALIIFWALVSGFSFYFSFDETGSTSDSSYSLKIGSIVIGAILVFIGRKMR